MEIKYSKGLVKEFDEYKTARLWKWLALAILITSIFL